MLGVPSLGWLFLDLNSYFATVEQQLDPALRGRPVAVVPVAADSTCAIAASYEAKAFGVRTGTPIYEAKRLCPGLRLVPARHELYVRFHHRIVAEIEGHLPVAAICSIDEVACRPLGAEGERANAVALARRIKSGIRERVGDCFRCSIGLAPNRFLAKLATELEKPDGLTVLELRDLPDRLLGLTLRDVPGIGANMERRLHRAGVFDLRALWGLAPKHARLIWGGVTGESFWYALHGYDLPERGTVRRSIGHSHVLDPALRRPEPARLVARRLALKAASRLRRLNYTAGALNVSVKLESGCRWEGGLRLIRTHDSFTVLQALDSLWRSMLAQHGAAARIKKVAVTLHDLIAASAAVTPDLFDGDGPDAAAGRERERRARLSAAIDRINGRYGRDTITLGVPPRGLKDFAGAKVAFSRIPDPAEFHE